MSLLTALEDQKRLRGFSVQDEVARARIDDDTEIVLGVDHFSMAFKEGFPGGAMLQSLLDSVIETVKPRISYLTVRYQHLCDLSHAQDYEKARAAAALSLLGSVATEISAVDSAILIDGTAGDGNTRYKVEFGIVNQHEAAHRLTEK